MFYLKLKKRSFKLTATDLESEVTTSGPLSGVESAGKTTTSAKKLERALSLDSRWRRNKLIFKWR